MAAAKNLKTCPEGHAYYKSSECPACPVCARLKKPSEGFLSLLSAPARRALESAGIISVKKLSAYTEKEIRALHGIGPSTIPKLIRALASEGLSFKQQNPL